MQNYRMIVDGEVHHIRADHPPLGEIRCFIELRTAKVAARPSGPNYDGTWNSILAAMNYEPVRAGKQWDILKLLIANNHQWIRGRYLQRNYGGEALRRVRALRHDYGWPIEERHVGRSVWYYRMNRSVKIERRAS